MDTANQIVNTIVGAFCILSVLIFILNLKYADPDKRVAITFTLASMFVMTIVNFRRDVQQMWIEVFLSVIYGWMMIWIYNEYKNIFKYPSRIFILTAAGLTLLAFVIELIF